MLLGLQWQMYRLCWQWPCILDEILGRFVVLVKGQNLSLSRIHDYGLSVSFSPSLLPCSPLGVVVTGVARNTFPSSLSVSPYNFLVGPGLSPPPPLSTCMQGSCSCFLPDFYFWKGERIEYRERNDTFLSDEQWGRARTHAHDPLEIGLARRGRRLSYRFPIR